MGNHLERVKAEISVFLRRIIEELQVEAAELET
jgi:hypothetical protein